VTSHYIPFTACVTDILDTTSLKLIVVPSICSPRLKYIHEILMHPARQACDAVLGDRGGGGSD
jgi:hypothetical protein